MTKSIASVIICAHNHLIDLTIPCLDHVLQNTLHPYELILIDDGSTDQTARYFETLRVLKTYRNAKPSGVTRSRNIGLMNAAGDLMVFLDNDCLVPERWLSILMDESQKDRVGVIAGIPTTELQRLKATPSADMLLDFAAVSGACMGITRQCLNSVGYLDETLINNGEDTDFCYRAYERGWRVASTPRLVVPHLGGGTRRELNRRIMEKSARRFRKKYYQYQDRLPMPPLYPFG